MDSTIPNELNILTTLPYYRLGLAAKQLGCEVSDLIYFGEQELVSVYLLLPTEHVASVHFPKVTDVFKNNPNVTPNPRCAYTRDKFIFDSNTFMRHFRIDEFEESEVSLRALLNGFWLLPRHIFNDINGDTLPDVKNLCVRISAETSEGDIAYADLNEWDFTPKIDDFYIKQADFMRLHKSLTEGGTLQIKKESSDQQKTQDQPPEKINVTTRQSDAIVEALKMAGFTDEELKGSIGGLQKKFAEKKATVLSSVDKNTLAKWLKSVRGN